MLEGKEVKRGGWKKKSGVEWGVLEKREGGSAGEWDKLEKREVKMGRRGMGWNIGEGKWGRMGRIGKERRRKCGGMG